MQPTDIAPTLMEYWSEVMAPGQKTVLVCLHFMDALPLKPTFKGAAKLLLQPPLRNLGADGTKQTERRLFAGPRWHPG